MEKISSRDERGIYVNDKGVVIKVSEYKDGSGVKIDFYDKSPFDPSHKSIHTHINNDGTYSTQDNVNGSNENSSGGCYLTSACMKYFQEKFDDNCYELTVLRWFRDNFVSKDDINHYYDVAPIIVDQINSIDDCNSIYKCIYEQVVQPCVIVFKKQIMNLHMIEIKIVF